ncbi:hypothetical protein RRG08_010280 [Elysia crispata]|uniref:Uncharacterized protein n=1 Tax=Elysia crispata TaxID=231223 RepID=A0AAE0Z3E6_9GAST|nr:hypothetical protein RRG08_010280 [Elysia crispata]
MSRPAASQTNATRPAPSSHHDIILKCPVDPLNEPFRRLNDLRETTQLYLSQAELFHLDASSGGARERQEQYIKFIITLLSPKDK